MDITLIYSNKAYLIAKLENLICNLSIPPKFSLLNFNFFTIVLKIYFFAQAQLFVLISPRALFGSRLSSETIFRWEKITRFSATLIPESLMCVSASCTKSSSANKSVEVGTGVIALSYKKTRPAGR